LTQEFLVIGPSLNYGLFKYKLVIVIQKRKKKEESSYSNP